MKQILFILLLSLVYNCSLSTSLLKKRGYSKSIDFDQTSFAEVRAVLGEPASFFNHSNGVITYIYTYSKIINRKIYKFEYENFYFTVKGGIVIDLNYKKYEYF